MLSHFLSAIIHYSFLHYSLYSTVNAQIKLFTVLFCREWCRTKVLPRASPTSAKASQTVNAQIKLFTVLLCREWCRTKVLPRASPTPAKASQTVNAQINFCRLLSRTEGAVQWYCPEGEIVRCENLSSILPETGFAQLFTYAV